MTHLTSLTATAVFAASWATIGFPQTLRAAEDIDRSRASKLASIEHIVVIYQENHSFDNLYGGWEGTNGRANADAAHTIQAGQTGIPYTCLLQNDFSLTSPPLSSGCMDFTAGSPFASHFTNAPFEIDAYIPVIAQTCPKPADGTNALPPNPNNLAGGARATWFTAFIRNSINCTGAGRTGTSPAAMRSALRWATTIPKGCRSTLTYTANLIRTTQSWTTSSRRLSEARS